jgi:hypothetical protein
VKFETCYSAKHPFTGITYLDQSVGLDVLQDVAVSNSFFHASIIAMQQ